jgi:hypothetical protein
MAKLNHKVAGIFGLSFGCKWQNSTKCWLAVINLVLVIIGSIPL